MVKNDKEARPSVAEKQKTKLLDFVCVPFNFIFHIRKKITVQPCVC